MSINIPNNDGKMRITRLLDIITRAIAAINALEGGFVSTPYHALLSDLNAVAVWLRKAQHAQTDITLTHVPDNKYIINYHIPCTSAALQEWTVPDSFNSYQEALAFIDENVSKLKDASKIEIVKVLR